MEIENTEVDVGREDIPGEGCKEEGCPKYYESGPLGRCGACDCILQGMSITGKACPVAAEKGYAEHSGVYGRTNDVTDRF